MRIIVKMLCNFAHFWCYFMQILCFLLVFWVIMFCFVVILHYFHSVNRRGKPFNSDSSVLDPGWIWIQLVSWIRIRIQYTDPDPDPASKIEPF